MERCREALEKRLQPFRLEGGIRETLTAVLSGEQLPRPVQRQDFLQPVQLWSFCGDSIAALKELLPEGIFHFDWARETRLQDLALYRQGNLMLGIVSHEFEGMLRVTTTEAKELARTGLVARWVADPWDNASQDA
jgi:hypothetical protein